MNCIMVNHHFSTLFGRIFLELFASIMAKHNRIFKGGGDPPNLIFPKVPQSSLGILRVPQLPP